MTNPIPELIPHPRAPRLSDPFQGPIILQQLVDEIKTGRFPTNEEFRGYMAEAGLVSLWFFGRCIAGLTGPYDEINATLHLDMCNVRQSWLTPGIRAAMFIPRGHFKSTIVTEIGTGWELVRDPNLRFGFVNAIADNPERFMVSVEHLFDSNETVQWVYPECAVHGNRDDWNKKVMVMPNRSIDYREPSIETVGVGGTSESKHWDVCIVDDPIGKKALNVQRQSNAVMEEARRWFKGINSLLQAPARSRVIVVGTRYAMDDIYQDVIDNSRLNLGYPMTNYEPKASGRWIVYYRKAVEDNEITFPERFDWNFYNELMNGDGEQWWEWVTQYLNEPYAAGLTDLSSFEIKPCWMEWSAKYEEYFISTHDLAEPLPLCDLDVLIAGDPAASDRRVSTKTSRSAEGVVATDANWNHYLLSLHADYVDAPTFFNWLFEDNRKFEKYVRGTFLESQGPFKVLEGVLREEQQRRKQYIKLRPCYVSGEKDARIRTALQPAFEQGRVYVLEPFIKMVEEEQKMFPQSNKKDILDMLSLAVRSANRPWSEKELEEINQEDNWFLESRGNACGY